MAIAVFKTFSAGEALSASDLNSSFTQIVNNGADLVTPFTKDFAAGGFSVTGMRAAAAAGEAVRYEQWTHPNTCEFRLTLTTALPVTTADVTAATTIYCTPYKGNRIALYSGSAWNVRTSAEFSLAIGAGLSSLPYDIFCYDNAGTPTLEQLVWTNGTTRATALVLQDGILVKTGATTRRYLGTYHPSGATTTEDSLAKRDLWNYYNRVPRPMRVLEATNTWAYTTATIRAANNSAGNRLNFVIGVSEDEVKAEIQAFASNTSANVAAVVGVGLDSTTEFTTGGLYFSGAIPVASTWYGLNAAWRGFPGIGARFLSWNEFSAATGTTTWGGDDGTPTSSQAGIHGVVWA